VDSDRQRTQKKKRGKGEKRKKPLEVLKPSCVLFFQGREKRGGGKKADEATVRCLEGKVMLDIIYRATAMVG